MKNYLILKLDTPCTLVRSAMRVPQAEPVNFARALITAAEQDELSKEQIVVRLLGTSVEYETEGFEAGQIEIVPYFGNPDSIKSYVDEETIVILWQGCHSMGVNHVKEPSDVAKPYLIVPFAADQYNRFQVLKLWQVQMYNLMASKLFEQVKKMYFIETDARLPLIELNKIDSLAVPKPLPKGIVLVTQAQYYDDFRKWHNAYGNGQSYNEVQIGKYCYQFEESMYLPLHCLPIFSHQRFAKKIADKQIDRAIFQVQSVKYLDDYRKSALRKMCNKLKGNVTLHGRFLAEERAIAAYSLGDYGDDMSIKDNSASSECFDDSAQYLADHKQSIIITDARYERFGLCPNRLVEAIAVHTQPVGDKSVVRNCDDTIKYAWSMVDGEQNDDIYEQTTELLKHQLIGELQKFNEQ